MGVKEILMTNKNTLPYDLTIEEVFSEMKEAPQVFEKCGENVNKILYTVNIRKSIKEGMEDVEKGDCISLEDFKEEMEGWFNEDNNDTKG